MFYQAGADVKQPTQYRHKLEDVYLLPVALWYTVLDLHGKGHLKRIIFFNAFVQIQGLLSQVHCVLLRCFSLAALVTNSNDAHIHAPLNLYNADLTNKNDFNKYRCDGQVSFPTSGEKATSPQTPQPQSKLGHLILRIFPLCSGLKSEIRLAYSYFLAPGCCHDVYVAIHASREGEYTQISEIIMLFHLQ